MPWRREAKQGTEMTAAAASVACATASSSSGVEVSSGTGDRRRTSRAAKCSAGGRNSTITPSRTRAGVRAATMLKVMSSARKAKLSCRWKKRSGGSSATAPSAEKMTQTTPTSENETRAPMR